MAIVTHELGPGTLILGAGPLDVSAQLTACKVTTSENVSTTDKRKVLSGETKDGSESVDFTHALEGSMFQDLSAAGVVAWSWTNRGTPQVFTFVPSTAAGRQVQGTLKPVPLQIGGDEVESDMEADFTWRIVGTPDFEAAA